MARRRSGPRRRRARLRHRVLLGEARAPRRARRSASTRRPRNSRPRAGCRRRPGSSSRSSRRPAEDVPLPDARSTSRSPSTARRSGPTRRNGSPRPRGCFVPAGGSLFLTNSMLAHLCTPDLDEEPITNVLVRPLFGQYRTKWPEYPRHRVPHLARRLDPHLARERLRARRAARAAARRRCEDARLLLRRSPPSGRAAGRARISGRRTCDDDEDSIAANIAEWTETNAQHTDANAQRAWDHEGILWGVFAIPEEQVGALPDVNGLDVVELGCGTAYFGSWLARRGARVTGVDPTPAQLATARRMMEQKGLEFPLVEAPGESVPLPDASFDLAVSEYGASLWADPVQVDPRGGAAAAPGRPARLPHELDARLPLRAHRRRRDGRRGAPARPVRDVPHPVGRRDRHRVPPLARRLDRAPAQARLRGRGAARAAAARGRRSTPTTTTTSPSSGRATGPPRRSG